MNPARLVLLVAALGLVPIALSYGVRPDASVPYLFQVEVSSTNHRHIFRAVMGLYLGFAALWLAGVFRPRLLAPALWSLVVFMVGLALGRIASLVLDGMPSAILLVYLGLELGFGVVGMVLLKSLSAKTDEAR